MYVRMYVCMHVCKWKLYKLRDNRVGQFSFDVCLIWFDANCYEIMAFTNNNNKRILTIFALVSLPIGKDNCIVYIHVAYTIFVRLCRLHYCLTAQVWSGYTLRYVQLMMAKLHV